PDGQRLATSSTDNQIRIWSAAGELERRIGQRNVVKVRFSRSGELASIGDGTLRFWRASDATLLQSLEAHSFPPPLALAFSTDGSLAATAGGDGGIRLWCHD